MTDIQRNDKGQIEAGSGSALGANSSRRAGTSQIARLRAVIEPERDAIVTALIATAKSGSKEAVRAAEVLLDRLAAKPRPTAELVRIEALAHAKTLQEKCDAVVAAVARGEVSADAGRAVLQMLDVYGRAKRVDELEARIKALEGLTPQRPAPDAPESLV